MTAVMDSGLRGEWEVSEQPAKRQRAKGAFFGNQPNRGMETRRKEGNQHTTPIMG